jgi:hypothetical protein
LQILLKRTTQALFLPILIPFAIFSVLIMVVIFTVLSFIAQLKKRTHKNPNCIIWFQIISISPVVLQRKLECKVYRKWDFNKNAVDHIFTQTNLCTIYFSNCNIIRKTWYHTYFVQHNYVCLLAQLWNNWISVISMVATSTQAS